MKIEITTEGQGRGTIVAIDDDRVRHITNLTLNIPIAGFVVLEIERLLCDEGGQVLLVFDENGNRRLQTETLRFSGTVTLEGDAL